MFKKLIITSSIFLLTSCATVSHKPLSQENARSIKTVYVNPEIKKPEKMYEFVSGSEFGMAFGAVGGAIAGIANENAAQSTQSFVEKNKVDIRQIINKQWSQQIANKTKYKLSKQPGDTILTTTILNYGISIPHGFSSDYVPILVMNAKLTRNNQIIWQDSGSVYPMTDGMPRYKINQLMADSSKFNEIWDKASERIVGKMLAKMNG